jgi:recombinational DNA repair ATPase RecF
MRKANPPSGKQAQIAARVIDLLRKDPEIRREFIDRVASPIANKMFEYGMIP